MISIMLLVALAYNGYGLRVGKSPYDANGSFTSFFVSACILVMSVWCLCLATFEGLASVSIFSASIVLQNSPGSNRGDFGCTGGKII